MTALIKPLTLHPSRLFTALLLMVVTWLAAEALIPHKYWANEIGDPDYAELMPQQFGDWVTLPNASAAVVNPVQAEMIDRIYTQTVAHAYRHSKTGRVIMVSLAYGKDQSTDTKLHTPDMCYASQGFRVDDKRKASLQTPWGALPAVQLKATMGQRIEPLTYLIRTGNTVTDGSLPRNLERLRLALLGFKMDGLLIRVSEITPQPDALSLQASFLNDMLGGMPDAVRAKFIGGQPNL